MQNTQSTKARKQARRAHRTRARLHGTASRPRMSVDRSLRFVSVQLVNDDAGVTLASATDKGMKEHMTRVERAVRVGQDIAKRAQDAGITTVVFDRGSAKYHGRVKALADAAREGGLKF